MTPGGADRTQSVRTAHGAGSTNNAHDTRPSASVHRERLAVGRVALQGPFSPASRAEAGAEAVEENTSKARAEDAVDEEVCRTVDDDK